MHSFGVNDVYQYKGILNWTNHWLCTFMLFLEVFNLQQMFEKKNNSIIFLWNVNHNDVKQYKYIVIIKSLTYQAAILWQIGI